MDPEKYHNADKFDKMLSEGLKRHSEPVRPGFTANVISKLEQEQQQKLLAKIVMQERLAIASCTAVGMVLLSGIIFLWKDILAVMSSSWNSLTNTKDEAFAYCSSDWNLTIIFAVTAVFILYALLDGVNLKKHIMLFKS